MHLLCIAHAPFVHRTCTRFGSCIQLCACLPTAAGGSAIALRAIRYAAALCSRFTASIRAAFALRYCPTGNTLRSRAMFSFHCEHTRGDAGKCLERFAQMNAII